MKKKFSKKIICIGDIILDEFITGSCDRISPEAPIPVLNYSRSSFFLGGVGNVAHNIKVNKFEPIIFSKISNDFASKKIIQLLKQKKISTEYLTKDKNFHLPHKVRFTSNKHHILRVDYEQTNEENNGNTLINNLKKFIRKNKFLEYAIISDYEKGNLSEQTISKIINILNKNNIKSVCDTKNTNIKVFQNSNILTPNEKEFNQILKKFDIKKISKKNQILKLLRNFKIKKLINTLGDKGCRLYDQEKNNISEFVTEKSEVYDVSGAGDVFIANLVCSLKEKKNINTSIKFAINKATQSVKMFGISAPIEKSKENLNKVLEWKKENKIIGFANGCFDIIHPGHLKLLKFAKQNCDKLVVAINSDNSYKKIKNSNGPFFNQASRKYNLEQYEFIDLVMVFREKTPLKLIKKIKPNFLFKGSDYKKENVIGYSYMKKYGGEIIIFNKLDDFSSSSILKKIYLNQ